MCPWPAAAHELTLAVECHTRRPAAPPACAPLRDLPQEVCVTGRTAQGRTMKELIEHIARSLVEYPEELEIREVDGTQVTVFELRAAKTDLGKLIGKHGKTVEAIRTVLQAASAKCGKRAVLEVLE